MFVYRDKEDVLLAMVHNTSTQSHAESTFAHFWDAAFLAVMSFCNGNVITVVIT